MCEPDLNTLNTIIPVIAILVVMVGWVVVHCLNVQRDRRNKLKDIQIEYLIRAYRSLANSGQRYPEKNSVYFRSIEAAISDIQLFGTTSQIEKIHILLPEYSKTAILELDSLLNDLRNDLRQELKLTPTNENVQWLRMEGAPTSPKPKTQNES